jgi:general secretion pathway protein D
VTGPGSTSVLDDQKAIYRVNFDKADLREAASSILGTTLGLDYLIDERVSGTITLETSKPVTQRTLLGMLDSALHMNGAALMYDSNLVRVVPEEVAKSSGMKTGTGEVVGYGATLFPLRYAAAGNVARTMAAIFTAPGAIVADEERNALILTGTAEERQGMIELASTFDVEWLSGRSIGLFPLHNARPEPVVRELEVIFGDATGAVPTGFAQFLPIDRLSAIMVVASDSGQLVQAQAWIGRLDRGSQSERSLRVYYVKNGKASDLANTLTKVFSGVATQPTATDIPAGGSPPDVQQQQPSGVITNPAGGGTGIGVNSQVGNGAMSTTSEGDQVVSATTDAQPSDGGGTSPGAIAGNAAPGLRVIADTANNSLLIMASPAEHQAIEKALQRLDILPMQVLIEVTIAEVTLNDTLKYGVEYYFNNNPTGALRGTGLSLASIGTLLTNSVAPGLNLLVDTGKGPDVVITALSALTDVKVVSSPQVVVQDNRTALLKVGDQVPVTIQQAVSTLTPDAPVVNSIQYVDTGVILKVTPRINSGGLVTCDVEQEVSSVSSDSLTGVLTPTISVRKIKSTVSVQSGQTVALGGLISETRNDNSSGLPVMSRIPVIGALFGTQENGLQRTELIVFITPRVIGSSEEARDVTLELRSRLQSLRKQAKDTVPLATVPPVKAPPPPTN